MQFRLSPDGDALVCELVALAPQLGPRAPVLCKLARVALLVDMVGAALWRGRVEGELERRLRGHLGAVGARGNAKDGQELRGDNARMARAACVGERQLERLCLRQLGRTPRQHLIWLRMHRAAELLSEGRLKIEAVANEVGYANSFVFSTTFKRCMGWKPSGYPGLGMAR